MTKKKEMHKVYDAVQSTENKKKAEGRRENRKEGKEEEE